MAKSTTTGRYITIGISRRYGAWPIRPRIMAFDAESEREACAKAGRAGNLKGSTTAWTVDRFLDLVDRLEREPAKGVE